MLQLLKRQVDDEGELAPEWADFIRRLLMNIRLTVDVEPGGDSATDALQECVLGEVAALLRGIQARTRPSMTSGQHQDQQGPDPCRRCCT